jgi:plasmid stabilization system protein ParE
MTQQVQVKLTENFESNLAELEEFLLKADALSAFDALLDELTDSVIPNLERFPDMGRLLMERSVRSVEVSNSLDVLRKKLKGGELREYLLANYLILYVRLERKGESGIYLLSIKHHRQLSFDFDSLWQAVL